MREQPGENHMAIRLGNQVPNFQQDSTEGKLDFYEFLGDSWGVLFSHPADFTPVCTTELGAVAGLKPEWEKRNVKVIGLSVDPPDSHMGWAKDIEETQGHALNFPLIADADRSVSTAYDMLDGDEEVTATVRSVFVVDPNKNLRLSLTYPPSTGRNFAEILRAIDSLQLTDSHKVATPANWRDGEDVVILPTVSNEDADSMFPKGYEVVKPYLRVTPQPNR
jgi:alkyl hydroperoxide reductase subunit AhpC